MSGGLDAISAQLIRPEINNLPDYNAGLEVDRFRAEYGIDCKAKLDSNENPYGPGKRCIAAIEAAAANIASYPDAGNLKLRGLLGRRADIAAGRIVVGNGSEDLIGATFRALLSTGNRVITVCPSFGLHEFSALACGASVLKLKFEDDWRFPVDAICAALADRPKILIFSSPSNPAGPAIGEAEFRQILSALTPDTLFVFDEAYREFLAVGSRFDAVRLLEGNGTPWISLSTFSKAYGLAGARVGYALCYDETIAGALMKVRNPFGVNALATAAVIAALADEDHMHRSVGLIVAERERVRAALVAMGHVVAPSQANFLFFDCGMDGVEFAENLRHKGILIKGWRE
ncbi:MAG: aminotransferase class I/II-fold pyridoxal phosphate-dependent enzyme, partial [Planctomycetota bacterium]